VDNVVDLRFYEFVGSEVVYIMMTLSCGSRRSKNEICVPSELFIVVRPSVGIDKY
jgi:hypothetical protein